MHWSIIALVGFFLLALIHVERFRQQCVEVGWLVFRPVRALVAEVLPRYIPLAAIRKTLLSWPAQLLLWYIVKPGLVCLLVYAFVPWLFSRPRGNCYFLCGVWRP